MSSSALLLWQMKYCVIMVLLSKSLLLHTKFSCALLAWVDYMYCFRKVMPVANCLAIKHSPDGATFA